MPQYLVVEDDPGVAKGLARFLARFGKPTVVGTVEEALRLLGEGRTWCAFFLDLALPDGSGLDVLARVRTLYPHTPALVLTGSTERDAINGAYELDAEYVVKPVKTEHLERFLNGPIQSFEARLDEVVEAWRTRYKLSAAQTDVLARAARGEDSDAIARGRGAALTTVKKQISQLIEKTGDSGLRVAVERLLRETVGH